MQALSLLLLIICILYTVHAKADSKLSDLQYSTLFATYSRQFAKNYEATEVIQRYKNFKENLDYVIKHNSDPEETVTLGMNEFADMNVEEWSQMKGLRVPQNYSNLPDLDTIEQFRLARLLDSSADDDDNTPKEIDWREKGVVNPVYNQGRCGSCWAWASASAVESAWAIKTGTLYQGSVQQFMDCSKNGNYGCNGGFMSNAYHWLKNSGGLCTYNNYPYRAQSSPYDTCRSCSAVMKINGYNDLRGLHESYIMEAVRRFGPVTVGVQSNRRIFMLYKRGIISARNRCVSRPIRVDHAVVVVGLKYSRKHKIYYYIVRNSYGAGWGDNGYLMIEAGKNVCGITSHPVVPRVNGVL